MFSYKNVSLRNLQYSDAQSSVNQSCNFCIFSTNSIKYTMNTKISRFSVFSAQECVWYTGKPHLSRIFNSNEIIQF